MKEGGGLHKFIGGGAPCPDGLLWDEKLQDCVPVNLEKKKIRDYNFHKYLADNNMTEEYWNEHFPHWSPILHELPEVTVRPPKSNILIKDYTYPKGTEAALAWETEKQQFPSAADDADDWYQKWYKARMTKPEFAEVAKQRYSATINRKTPYTLEPGEIYNAEGHSGRLATTYIPHVNDPANLPYENKIFINSTIQADNGDNDFHNTLFQGPKYAKDYLKHEMIHEKSHWDENNYVQPGTSRHNIEEDVVLNKALPKKYLKPGKNTSIYNFDFNKNLSEGALDYLSTPTEIRARLNRWREYNNIDPLKDYTPAEIKKIINKNVDHFKNDPFTNIDDNILELYNLIHADPNILKTLNDKYVSNGSNKDLDTAEYGGLHKFVGGGASGCPKGEYWNGTKCVKIPKNTRIVYHTDKDVYDKAFAAESDSSHFYNNAKSDFNKFDKLGDRFSTPMSNEEWQKVSDQYYKLLDSQSKKWHTDEDRRAVYIPNYTVNYKYKGPKSGLTIKPVGLEGFYREGYKFPKFKKPVVHNVYEEPIEEEFIPMPIKKPELIDTTTGDIIGQSEQLLAPEYSPSYPENRIGYNKYNWNSGKQVGMGTKWTLPKRQRNTGGFYKKANKKVEDIQNYMEGYEDEDGNYIPGEIEKAEQEGRQIKFKGNISKTDKKAQETYNKEYDEYENLKNYQNGMMNLMQYNLNKKQYGGLNKFVEGDKPDNGIITQEEIDAANTAMMKARLAYANEFGNPAAKRMINLPDEPYQFDNGDMGTHYMASMDNYAVPQIQDENGQLMLGDYGPESNEAIRFDSDEDANYFAENYKDVSPGFMELELSPEEIEEYAKGGYIVEDISVPSLNRKQLGGLIKSGKNLLRGANIATLGTANTLAKNLAPVMINPARIPMFGAQIDKVGPFTGSPLNVLPGYGKKMESTPGTAFRKFGDTLDYVKMSGELNPAHGPLLRMGKDQVMSEGNWAELNEPNEQYSGVFGAQFDTRVPGSDLSFKTIPKRNGVLVTDASGNLKPIIPISDPGLSFHRRLPFSNRYIPVDMNKLRNDQFDWRTVGGNAQSLLERYGYAAGYAGLLGAMGLATPQEYIDQYINEPIMKGYNKYIKPGVENMQDVIRPKRYGLKEDGSYEEYSKGGWIVEELDNYAEGGQPCPDGYTWDETKQDCVSLIDTNWLSNWYANRKLPLDEIPNKKYVNLMKERLPQYNPESTLLEELANLPPVEYQDVIDDDPNNQGQLTYDKKYNPDKILLKKSLLDDPVKLNQIYNSEASTAVDVNKPGLFAAQNMVIDPGLVLFEDRWGDLKGTDRDDAEDHYNYITDPEQDNIHSLVFEERYKRNLKSDQVITEADINKWKSEAEANGALDRNSPNFDDGLYTLFKLAKDNKSLMNWFNQLASNDKTKTGNKTKTVDEPQYAKQGGAMGYELGEEIDEATMKKLKKLGYTFETI
jgi:hypothetical protein